MAIGPFFMMCSFVSPHISLRAGYGGDSSADLMLIMRDDTGAAACLTSVSARALDRFWGCRCAETRVSDSVDDGPLVEPRRFRGGLERRPRPALGVEILRLGLSPDTVVAASAVDYGSLHWRVAKR